MIFIYTLFNVIMKQQILNITNQEYYYNYINYINLIANAQHL